MPPTLTATAEIVEERTALSDAPRCLVVKVIWSSPDVKIDRPFTFGISVRWMEVKLAERLKRAIDDQKVFTNPQVRIDVNGNTYVHSDCLVMGRRMNADLKRLGY